MPWPGFDEQHFTVGDASYYVVAAGAGPPVLLLHGFPETHLCWRDVAPQLTSGFRAIAVDLRGYGWSVAPAGGARGDGYSKRDMARELVELMALLGHDRFAIVGHDRGARVAYRLALDSPERVAKLALLNILPTVEQFERMGAGPSLGFWPWFLLAQPAPFPEHLLASQPTAIIDHVFATWASRPESVSREVRDTYSAALSASTIASMCADYRASFHIDRAHDAEDRDAGRRIAAPTLVLTGEDEVQLADAAAVWERWTTQLDAARVPGGHFLPEESPAAVTAAVSSFLTA
jgi:haloacetate dehalogenase